jgi:putative transposase
MIPMPSVPARKGFRFPREVILHAAWAFYRFAMSLWDVVDLLAARGVVVSHESLREWINRFGSQIAARIRRVPAGSGGLRRINAGVDGPTASDVPIWGQTLIHPLILNPQLSVKENRTGRVGFLEGIGIG